ncbi:MAG TPA: T9SS type A sorting domain-containing protein [Bacteroidota bacterium]|nr:T9SS type A sorting domain-containing protein [Bacteroidota bacterium]
MRAGALLAVILSVFSPSRSQQLPGAFVQTIVDARGPVDPWGKAAGDINGDGRIDLLVGGYTSGGLVWYQNPGWTPHVISLLAGFRTEMRVVDLDRDGKNDVVVLAADSDGNPIVGWYKNPGPTGSWTLTSIEQRTLHNVDVADLNGDTLVDVVARDQMAYGHYAGDVVYVYLQVNPSTWTPISFPCVDGEGLRVVDINNDGRPDIVIGGSWFENTAGGTVWVEHPYTTTYTCTNVTVAVADINGDGRKDIVLAPAEDGTDTSRVSWFEAPADPRQPGWTEHIVEAGLQTVQHFVGAADFNLDGQMDIASAAMNTGEYPQEVRIYYNGGKGLTWTKQVLSNDGSHQMQIADVDNDGDMDLFGANWQGRGSDLWLNPVNTPAGLPEGGARGAPLQFHLAQNYPNPFNPATTITFTLPASAPARLTVYSILGQEVATLVDGYLSLGTHTVRFDGSRLPTGVYIARLIAGSNRASVRLNLVK